MGKEKKEANQDLQSPDLSLAQGNSIKSERIVCFVLNGQKQHGFSHKDLFIFIFSIELDLKHHHNAG